MPNIIIASIHPKFVPATLEELQLLVDILIDIDKKIWSAYKTKQTMPAQISSGFYFQKNSDLKKALT